MRFSNPEVLIALAVAGLVNMAMVMMASGAFHAGHPDVAEIETAYHTLTPLLGIGAAGVFLVSLIASGVSSSVVGTMAGQMIMQGFVGFRIPIWLRRRGHHGAGLRRRRPRRQRHQALVISQVVLSLVLPVPMIALLMFTRRRGHHGRVRQRPPDPDRRRGRDRAGAGAQRVPDRADRRRADPGSAIKPVMPGPVPGIHGFAARPHYKA